MKNHFSIRQATNLIIGFSIVSLLLFSCKKDSDDEGPDDSGSYMISFKANGVLQEVVGAAISYLDGQTIYLTGFQNPNVTIKIIKITSTTVRGTFSGTPKSNGKADIVY